MATGAWVLVLPWACGLEEWLGGGPELVRSDSIPPA